MRRFLFIIAIFFLTALNASYAQEAADPSAPNVTSVQPVSTTHTVGSDGAFTYEVPIKIPEFRGLLPNLRFTYNSQNQTRRGSDMFIGAGWRLGGMSTIERFSDGGGVPTYSLKNDVFRLDGVELLACRDSKATNKWPWDYPANYRTNVESASCSSGGNMVALRDNFLKVVRNSGDLTKNSSFYVYRPDGVRYTYKTVGELKGVNPNKKGDIFSVAYRRQWVLTEIRDKQKSPNIVRISYHISDQYSGFAPRPRAIEYAGYKVEFHYKNTPHPVTGYATGTQYIAQQKYRLNAITVKNGGTQIRAYALYYAQSNQTKVSLLKAVREYGSNYTLRSASITGGSHLPAWKFSYQGDYTYFNHKGFGKYHFHTSMSVVDTDDNGRDELLFWPFAKTHSDRAQFTLPAKQLMFKENGWLERAKDPNLPDTSVHHTGKTDDDDMVVPVGVTRRDQTTNQQYAITWRKRTTWKNKGPQPDIQFLSSYRVGSTSQVSSVDVDTQCKESFEDVHVFLGQFDLDAESEVIVGNRIYNINDGKFSEDHKRRGILGNYFCNDWRFDNNGIGVADIDGDGIDEIIGKDAYLDVRAGEFVAIRMSNSPFESQQTEWVIRFGDVNGDGAADAVVHNRSGEDRVGVAISTGHGFKPIDWSWWDHLRSIDTKDSNFGSPRSFVRDLNGDGLADIIIHEGFTESTLSANSGRPLAALPAHIYLSDGKRFFKHSQSARQKIPEFLGLGDFDGDGLIDAVSGNSGSKGDSIYYNGAQVPNLLDKITDQLGGTTEVQYSPSTKFADNNIPGVQQLVTRITRKSGFSGQDKVTTYAYVGSKYDYRHRRSLGFRTITAYLPKATGETENPTLVTTYEQAHWGVKGRVRSKILIYKKATQRLEIHDWSYGGQSDLPLRSQRKKTRSKELWGGMLLEKTVEYNVNLYNQPTRIIKRGFGGVEPGKDDVTTAFSYQVNKADYIVDKPEWMIVGNGASVSYGNRGNWLRAEYYSYDGSTRLGDIPSRGNLSSVAVWSGGNNHDRRVERQIGYDNYGNVTWERNARSIQTNYKYDSAKRLFRTETRNAADHVSTVGWNYACQAPTFQKDINGLSYTFSYDVFCRQTRQIFPNGQDVRTSYHYIGSPTDQYVRQRSYSASTVSGMKHSEERQYFNGYGQTYKSTKSGTRDRIEDAIVTQRAFDGRGNLAWESTPRTWAQSSGNYVAANARTSFLYDPLDRLMKRTNPDGTYSTIEYATDRFTDQRGQRTNWPTQVTRDEHCYDTGSAGTICGVSRHSVDATGDVIRNSLNDSSKTDYASGDRTVRITKYSYDNLGRLIGVVDPIGAIWSYSYNAYGDRTVSNDPALGRWTMQYDANGNLIRQVDAKNQTIEIAYDTLDRVTLKRVGSGDTRTDTRYYYDQDRPGYYNKGQLTSLRVWNKFDGHYHAIYRNYGNEGRLRKETNDIGGRRYDLFSNYRKNGELNAVRVPNQPGSTRNKWLPSFQYDAASRLISFGPYIKSTDYNLWGKPTRVNYGNGTYIEMNYHSARGWLDRINIRNSENSQIDYTQYSRSATGRVREQKTDLHEGWLRYTYDYAGRLRTVNNTKGKLSYNQSFTYDKAGSMRSNSLLGDYFYHSRKHTPYRVKIDGKNHKLSYDANGNMLRGIRGKAMVYDGENRPVSVTYSGKTTRYVYGADGSRLKLIENAGTSTETITVTFGMVEIRNYGQGRKEVIITQPHPDVRFVNDKPSYMHRDQLQSVRMVTNQAGARAKRTIYKPFGEAQEWNHDLATPDEATGWIGERYDDGAGLQYLNARYYDPELGLFIQSD